MLRVLKAAQCSLQAPCLHNLAALPCLTELYLAGNQIAKLPRTAIAATSFTLLQVSHLISHCFALLISDFPLLPLIISIVSVSLRNRLLCTTISVGLPMCR